MMPRKLATPGAPAFSDCRQGSNWEGEANQVAVAYCDTHKRPYLECRLRAEQTRNKEMADELHGLITAFEARGYTSAFPGARKLLGMDPFAQTTAANPAARCVTCDANVKDPAWHERNLHIVYRKPGAKA